MTASTLTQTALRHYEFNALVAALLAQQPAGTAMVLTDDGRISMDDQGSLFAFVECGVQNPWDDSSELDGSAWNDELGCFDGETVADTWRYLTRPVFDYRRCAGVALARDTVQFAIWLGMTYEQAKRVALKNETCQAVSAREWAVVDGFFSSQVATQGTPA